MTLYENQPIENAKVFIFNDNGISSLVIEPNNGFKLRIKGNDTFSTTQIVISIQFAKMLEDYIAVPIDDPDQVVEIVPDTPTEEEVDDRTALEELTEVIEDDKS